jgi:hypothetical protein
VTFESDSRLTEIGREAFWNCSSLGSICIPAQVQRLLRKSFANCCSLTELLCESSAKVNQIESGAFDECRSLRTFCIPSQLEVMEWGLLCDCESLTELTFEIPSHIKKFELPPSEFGSLCIPDSVQVILGSLRPRVRRNCLLRFGEESQLKVVRLNHPASVKNSRAGIGVFLCFSERQLRDFRSKPKFS